ncbi:hypothetical protein PHMEG_0007117 [Phytophthora megakarya]|uniref:Uncharacterized protein n=1 Tax=Phytophthora megakarya TaxID=4795 RepID=A0A225WPJ1_9STRA|nr:hypothetical protein PHMEG_0007117 [Phytophthora megakarya]
MPGSKNLLQWRKQLKVPVGANTHTGGNLISAKWVFKLMFDNKDELERFKVRLVAHGYSQNFDIEFAET